MSYTPDSLLTASKKLAEVSGLPWAHVQKYYRALQGTDGLDNAWLPKSAGRNIWFAHPNYICRLIIALAASASPDEAIPSVDWVMKLAPLGSGARGLHPAAGIPSPIESLLFAFLVDPAKAATLHHIEFIPESRMLAIRYVDGFGTDDLWKLPDGGEVLQFPQTLIRSRGIVDGDLFVALAKSINWRRHDNAPLTKGVEDDE